MASRSRVEDVVFAVQRAKKKISSLQEELSSRETSPSTLTPSKELRDTLVDMYPVNPAVNSELQQRLLSRRLGSPDRWWVREDRSSWTQGETHRFTSLLITSSPVCPRLSPSDTQLTSPGPLTDKCVSRASTPSGRPAGAGGSEMNPPQDGDVPDEGRACVGQALWTEDSSHEDVRHPIRSPDAPHTLDLDKNVSFLLKELDALRDANNKLQDQLIHKEKELQRREVEDELREEQREAQDWERPAALLEEVLAVQKDRDQAMMSRLLLANEERDEALLHARQLQQASESENLHLDECDMDVDELLHSVCAADSAQDVQRFGSVLIQRLQMARQRRRDITAEEMKAVMEERDSSAAKCKQLEQGLIQEREQRASEEQQRLRRQRGGALEDRLQLGAGQQLSGTNHSGDTSPVCQGPPSLLQLQQLSREKQSMEAELLRCQEAEQEANERVRRLERLVDVLRKKVGTGSLRAVI